MHGKDTCQDVTASLIIEVMGVDAARVVSLPLRQSIQACLPCITANDVC